jgi:D-2-hydroxyglutarate dehydrogenase
MGDGSVVDGTVASSISQAAAIWRVREGISEALTKRGESWRIVSEESNSVRSG